MSNSIRPTRTSATVENYIARAKRILCSIPFEMVAEPDNGLHPCEVVKWLRQKAPALRKATFRQYKAALICHFESIALACPDAREDYLDAIDKLKSIPCSIALKRSTHDIPERTSSRKAKRIHQDDLAKLGAQMTSSKSLWRHRAFSFLVAGINTGLRPCEWEKAQMQELPRDPKSEKIQMKIIVQNAKTTNGRGSGKTRVLDLIVSESGAKYIRYHCDYLSNWLAKNIDRSFNDYYSACRSVCQRFLQKNDP